MDEAESRDVLTKLQRTAERFPRMRSKRLAPFMRIATVMNAVKRQSPLLAAYPDTFGVPLSRGHRQEICALRRTPRGRVGWRGFLQSAAQIKALAHEEEREAWQAISCRLEQF